MANSEIVTDSEKTIETHEIEKVLKIVGELTLKVEPFVLPKSSEMQKSLAENIDLDPLFDEVAEWAKKQKEVSLEKIKRTFVVGHIRASRIFEQLRIKEIIE